MTSADIPSWLEPTSLMRSDGKRPDSVTLAPWKCAKVLTFWWQCTPPVCSGRLLARVKGLPLGHLFAPIAIEIMGAIGPRSLAFLKELGYRIRGETREPKSTEFLVQHVWELCSSVGQHWPLTSCFSHILIYLLLIYKILYTYITPSSHLSPNASCKQFLASDHLK